MAYFRCGASNGGVLPKEMTFNLNASCNKPAQGGGAGRPVNGSAGQMLPDFLFENYKKFTVITGGTYSTCTACGKGSGTYNIAEATDHSLYISMSSQQSTEYVSASGSVSVTFHNS